MAGPEVVDGQADSQAVQLGQDGGRRFHVVHGQALGDLEEELGRVHAGDVQHVRDLVLQTGVLELAG